MVYALDMSKPSKPYHDFPLFPRATGQWAKKIRGRTVYFGKWDDPDAALSKYEAEREALHAGRVPRETTPAAGTLHEVANLFLARKAQRVEIGELSQRMWDDYKHTFGHALNAFGKHRLITDVTPADFANLYHRMAKRWGPYRLGKAVQMIRSLFRFAYDEELIPAPVRFGDGFKRPSKMVIRLHRAARGPRLFTAQQVIDLLGIATVPMQAMIHLGINGGLGNHDCGTLPRGALDLDTGWMEFPRPKTGLHRRIPLWPETVAALRTAIAKRPDTKNPADEGLVFVTRHGGRWSDNMAVAQEFLYLTKRLKINSGLGFYTLRHTFRTVADESRDQPATDFIMGHESPHMSSIYRERISDERLRAVTNYVHAWLYGK
jgi:integrase